MPGLQGSPAPSGAPRTSSACWSASTAARTSSSTSTARCWPTACCTSSASAPSGEACGVARVQGRRGPDSGQSSSVSSSVQWRRARSPGAAGTSLCSTAAPGAWGRPENLEWPLLGPPPGLPGWGCPCSGDVGAGHWVLPCRGWLGRGRRTPQRHVLAGRSAMWSC